MQHHTHRLHLIRSVPFIGSSPYVLIECKCHGKGRLEIKCSCKMSLYRTGLKDQEKDKNVNADNTIKINHKYYSQIQGQMLVSHQYYCNLFIQTPIENKKVTVGVLEDDKFCKSMLQTVLLRGSLARIFYKEIWYLCSHQAAKLLLLQAVMI